MSRLIDLNKVKRRGYITGTGEPVKFVMNMDQDGKTRTPGFNLKSYKKIDGFVMEDGSVDYEVNDKIRERPQD